MAGKKGKNAPAQSSPQEAEPKSMTGEGHFYSRRLLIGLRILATAGLLVSAYLATLHFRDGLTAVVDSPFCGAGSTINCSFVLSSTYANLFGVPVALLGALSYVLLIGATLYSSTAVVLLTTGWMLVFSLYMAAVSFFQIEAICPMCTSLYVVNVGLFTISVSPRNVRASMPLPRIFYSLLAYVVVIIGIAFNQSNDAAFATAPKDYRAPATQNLDTGFVSYYRQPPAVILQTAGRHSEGPLDALVTIHEFVDFRCPQCAKARDTLTKLQHANPDDVRVVFRHYPLDQQCNPGMKSQVHPGACLASIAAECAGEQGDFWGYADRLYADQTRFRRTDFEQIANNAGLDIDKFNACLDDGRTRQYVMADIEEATRLDIKGTPTLVVNGRLIKGIPPAAKLATLVTLRQQELGKGL